MPDSFTTARLTAERLAPSHLADLTALHLDAAVMRTLGGMKTPEQTADYLAVNLEHWDRHGFGLWVLREADGRFAGRAGVRHLTVLGSDEVEIAYTFRQDRWGAGYASEIAAALVQAAFGPLGLADLVGITLVDNLASRRVLEKTGFVYERAYRNDGHDLVLYRLTAAGAR
jgi:RimJ/RimL family protein N-acetyltransferase